MTQKLKEVQFGPNTSPHDMGYRIKHIRAFLDQGHRVRVVVKMRGRELAHPELAAKMMETVLAAIPGDFGVSPVKQEDRQISTTLVKGKSS